MKENEQNHPSYGIVSFSRVAGNPGRLFGSKLPAHNSFITLRVSKATLITNEHGEERFYGSMRGDVVEVQLSNVQFAELLTTMNAGQGVPCTISLVDMKPVERPPQTDNEATKTRKSFRTKLSNLSEKIVELANESSEILEKKSILKPDRDVLKSKISSLCNEVRHNLPFFLEVFEEAAEKVVSAARTEIDSTILNSLQIAKKIVEKSPAPFILPEKGDGGFIE